jgi:hypothetical protein
MAGFKNMVDGVIEKSDIVLMVIDARAVRESINPEIEEKIKAEGKKFLYIINKVDLLEKEEQKKIRLENSVQVSSKLHWGNMRLLRKIKEISKGKPATVGVVGYPNTGKSSIINALAGKKSAGVSPKSGYTKSIQKIKIAEGIYIIDTPGVFSKSGDDADYVIYGAKDPDNLKDPELVAAQIISKMNGLIERHYGVDDFGDPFEAIEKIAIKENVLKKGGAPNTSEMSKKIMRDLQKGKIKKKGGN